LSKFERYKKKDDTYIYPHKHCKKCGEMISEALTYCTNCYEKMQEKKKRRFFKRKRKKE
jgi:predicted nucleic acid-binding Zn ribbon protein